MVCQKSPGEHRIVTTMCIGSVEAWYNFIDMMRGSRSFGDTAGKMIDILFKVSYTVSGISLVDLILGMTNKKIDEALNTIEKNLRYKQKDEPYAFTWSIVQTVVGLRTSTVTFLQSYTSLARVWYFS